MRNYKKPRGHFSFRDSFSLFILRFFSHRAVSDLIFKTNFNQAVYTKLSKLFISHNIYRFLGLLTTVNLSFLAENVT
jgi:hypothetical protein